MLASSSPPKDMPSPLPPPVQRAIKQLASNVSRARRRRQLSQADLAEQIGASVSTVRRLEKGDAGVALQHLVTVLFVMGEIHRIKGLLDTPSDSVGLMLQDERLPKRIRRAKSSEV
jgi:transcriptional regulator with XRE-family HTH domain